MNTNEKFFREYGNLILPEIGEVSIMVQGDEFKKPHFHVYDHKNKIDYCIDLYDGTFINYSSFESYKPGKLNNNQLQILDEWKIEPVDKSRGFMESKWRDMAWFFDHSFNDDILEIYSDDLDIPQYHK